MKFYIVLLLFCMPFILPSQELSGPQGGLWLDNNGVHINAHGGGMLYQNDTYYWFGEHKTEGKGGNRANVGVHCYSSNNLMDWTDEGIALKMSEDTTSLLVAGCILERPKVIYNELTKKYVMWFHHELKDQGYDAAMTGLAISDTPSGPYEYIRSLRPNAGIWPMNFPDSSKEIKTRLDDLERGSEEWKAWSKEGGYLRRDFEGGQMCRDMALFIDVDDRAYHMASSEENQTLHIRELTDDYQDFTGKYVRVLPAGRNEGPAIFRKDGKYYMITSGLTGWKPNPGKSAMADSIMGEWTALGNPCIGTEEEENTTFESQSTYAIDMDGKGKRYILMADRWRPENAIDGRYVWIQIDFDENNPILKWENVFEGK
jgi:hypothetical protein